MLVISKDLYKLVVASQELVDDNKKDQSGNWVPIGTKSYMCKYIFKNLVDLSMIIFSSKNDLLMNEEGKEGKIIVQVSQFGTKKPEAKFVTFEIQNSKK